MDPTVTATSASKRERGRVAGFRLLKSNKVVFLPADKRRDITVGRTRQRDIRVRHPTVSRLHCTIDMTVDDRYMISNAASKNGLEVAERGRCSQFRPVEWHILEVGNYVRLGDVALVAIDANGEWPITASSGAELADIGMKISDLGLAKPLTDGQAETSDIRGKLSYASPESILRRTMDARADLYSFGAMLYELLGGSPPFGHGHDLATLLERLVDWRIPELPDDGPHDGRALAMGYW